MMGEEADELFYVYETGYRQDIVLLYSQFRHAGADEPTRPRFAPTLPKLGRSETVTTE